MSSSVVCRLGKEDEITIISSDLVKRFTGMNGRIVAPYPTLSRQVRRT
jgi:hypothetical protein